MTHRGVAHPGVSDADQDILDGLKAAGENQTAPASATSDQIGQLSLADFLAGTLQPGDKATTRTRTLPNGDTYTFLLDGNGNVLKGSIEYNPRVVKEGPIVPLFVEEGPNGSTIVILSGGKSPLVFNAQVDLSQEFQLIPGTDTLVAREPDGTIRTIQRSQVPIQAIQTDSQVLSDGTIRQFFADGSHRDVAPLTQFQLGQIQERGGSQFVETSPGNFSRLPQDLSTGEVVNIDGRQFIKQPDGSIQPLASEAAPTIKEMIAKALFSGNVDAALALKDFQDRPTSLEAFNAAMQFAQSPGDIFSISNIARGITPIVAPEAGDTQRIALPPVFLQDALSRVMNLFRGGSGTPNEFVNIIEQFAISEKQAQRTTEETQAELDKIGTAAAPFGSDAERSIAEQLGLTAEQARMEKEIAEDRVATAEAEALGVQIEANQVQRQIQNQQVADDPNLSVLPTSDPEGSRSFVLDVTSGLTAGSGAGGTITQEPTTVSEPLSAFQQQFVTGGSEEDDFFAGGGVFDDNTAIVGENGPELLIAKPGARVIPLPKGDAAKIKAKFGIKGLQEGGTLEPLLPFGIRQVLQGGSPEPTRRRLSTAAGIPVLSAQARQRLLPEELDVFNRIAAESGIPMGAFAQEQASATPGGVIQRAFRLTPRVAR